jgi:PAS domain S-box-containing protein
MAREQRKASDPEARWHEQLFDAIAFAQEQLAGVIRDTPLFEDLLAALLSLTESEYGFIGEVLQTDEGLPYLKTLAISNVAWKDETRQMYEDNAPALDGVNDAVITRDEAGVIQSVNRAALSTLGDSGDEMLGQNVSMIVGEPYRADHHAALQSFIETGHSDILGVERILVAARTPGRHAPAHRVVPGRSTRRHRQGTHQHLARGDALSTSMLPQPVPRRGPPDRSTPLDALELNGGNRAAAARPLGVIRATLYRWLSRLEP